MLLFLNSVRNVNAQQWYGTIKGQIGMANREEKNVTTLIFKIIKK